MKKIIFLVVLLGLANLFGIIEWNSNNEWSQVGVSDSGFTVYVDYQSIRTNENKVKMSALFDFKTAKTFSDDNYLSEKETLEFDCYEETSELISFTRYSGKMGKGKVVVSTFGLIGLDRDLESPQLIKQGTVFALLYDQACDKKASTYILRVLSNIKINLPDFKSPKSLLYKDPQQLKWIQNGIVTQIKKRLNLFNTSGISGVSKDIEKCYGDAASGKKQLIQACVVYDATAFFIDRSVSSAFGLKDLSATPFLNEKTFNDRQKSYKEKAFGEYSDEDATKFINETRDSILNEVMFDKGGFRFEKSETAKQSKAKEQAAAKEQPAAKSAAEAAKQSKAEAAKEAQAAKEQEATTASKAEATKEAKAASDADAAAKALKDRDELE